jgi:hypothetical protein
MVGAAAVVAGTITALFAVNAAGPVEFTAANRKTYGVPLESDVTVADVAAEAGRSIVVHVLPPSLLDWIA